MCIACACDKPNVLLSQKLTGPLVCLTVDHDHWWSGCQIYGTTPARNRELRTGVDGKLLLSPDGKYLALDKNGACIC